MTDIEPSQNMIKVTQKQGYIWLIDKYVCAKVEGLDTNTANLF